MQFRDLNFRFNGINSKDKQLKIVNIEGDKDDILFGIEQDVMEEENGRDVPLFLGVKRKSPTIPITLMKMNEENIAVPFSKEERESICRWLIHKEYKPFVSYDNIGLVYYVIFTKGNNFENTANEGYIKLNMRLSAPYAYTNQLIDHYTVKGEKIIDLYNKSNVEEFIYPDIEIINLNEEGYIEIYNLTLNEKMTFNNLCYKEHIYAYNEGVKDVINVDNKSINVFNRFNKNWIRVSYGKNRIKIKGNCKIKFISQYPIALK